MTLQDYEQKFMFNLEDLWNDSAKYQFVNWDAFVYSMWQENERQIAEYNA
jgi:hypothetical protein